jgi:hypothetical protein
VYGDIRDTNKLTKPYIQVHSTKQPVILGGPW